MAHCANLTSSSPWDNIWPWRRPLAPALYAMCLASQATVC